ncbi:hypothetical protein Peur_033641 [Populus x canadensis]
MITQPAIPARLQAIPTINYLGCSYIQEKILSRQVIAHDKLIILQINYMIYIIAVMLSKS